MTQGSRFAATLGFEPESRWDSRMTRGSVRRRRRRGAVIPNSTFSPTFNHTQKRACECQIRRHHAPSSLDRPWSTQHHWLHGHDPMYATLETRCRWSIASEPSTYIVLIQNEQDTEFDSSDHTQSPRLRPRRTAEDQWVGQAQHKRKSVSAVAESVGGGESGGGPAAAALSESHRAAVARKAGEVPRVCAGKYYRRQRFGRITGDCDTRVCGASVLPASCWQKTAASGRPTACRPILHA